MFKSKLTIDFRIFNISNKPDPVMAICKHIEWLQVAGGKELVLINPGRMTRIVRELNNSTVQRPSILFFIGCTAKIQALRELFLNHIKKNCNDDFAMFQIDNTNFYSDFPIFFVDSDASTTVVTTFETFCHKIESFFIDWANTTTIQNVYDVLHARIFCPFSDVFCIFADDFSDFDSIVNHLKCWAITEKASNPF